MKYTIRFSLATQNVDSRTLAATGFHIDKNFVTFYKDTTLVAAYPEHTIVAIEKVEE